MYTGRSSSVPLGWTGRHSGWSQLSLDEASCHFAWDQLSLRWNQLSLCIGQSVTLYGTSSPSGLCQLSL